MYNILNFTSNGILLLLDNESKHKSEMHLDYDIENKIQLLKLSAYNLDLNLIKKISKY